MPNSPFCTKTCTQIQTESPCSTLVSPSLQNPNSIMSFIAMPTVPDQVFGAGMELVPLPAEYMSLPFVPSAHGPSMVVPPSSIPARSALKTTSLSRMEELSSMLTQLNDPSYTQCYVKVKKLPLLLPLFFHSMPLFPYNNKPMLRFLSLYRRLITARTGR